MKRKISIWLGLIFLAVLVTLTVILTTGNEQSTEPQEKKESEQIEKELSETKEDEEEKEDETEEPVEILTNSDPRNTMPDYIEEGDLCYEIDDVIKRGDCFQDVHSSYSLWAFDTSKEDFYYPYHHNQGHWQELFYFKVLENDELGEAIHTDAYEEYKDVHASSQDKKSEDERGIKIVNDYWYIFSSLIPQEERKMLTEITWFDTGEDLVLGAGLAEGDITEMALLFSHNTPDYYSHSKTRLIHEYGHMLTLNNTQVELEAELLESEDEDEDKWNEAEEKCSTLFVSRGCLKEDSYLYAFYKDFWKDINDDYELINWEDEEDYKEFFFEHEERFYNSYQGTSPSEDIVDAFLIFVMKPSKVAFEAKEIKDEKLAFFYEYEELADLRTAILENLFELNKKDEQFY